MRAGNQFTEQNDLKGTQAVITNWKIQVFSLAGILALSACGDSQFKTMIASECQANNRGGGDCSCIAKVLNDGLPDHLKTAFPALRWPLKPAPQQREAVNGALLRSAGVDPADRQAVESIKQEFQEKMHFLDEQARNQCGGRL